MPLVPTLFPTESARLKLRAFNLADIESLASYRSAPEVARYQSWETPFSQRQAREMIRSLPPLHPTPIGDWTQIALELKESGLHIGDLAVNISPEDPIQAEIGYSLAPSHWGQGLATEAVRRLLGILFGEICVHRVTAQCDARNDSSARLLGRCGFRQEAHHVQNYWSKGEWTDTLVFALLRQEWTLFRDPDDVVT